MVYKTRGVILHASSSSMSHSKSAREISLAREAKDDEARCCICMHRFANTVLEPCGHSEFCWICAFRIAELPNATHGCAVCRPKAKCPLCTAVIVSWKPVNPPPNDLTQEERIRAQQLELDTYDEAEQQQYAESFGMTVKEMLANLADKLEELEFSE